jgi:hypothetical protein
MKYGWSNDFESAETNDPDGDGRPTWMEWVSDTDPTNPLSALQIRSFTRDANGMWIGWQGGTSARQYLERSASLTSGAPWTPIFSNTPPVPASTNILDQGGTNGPLFYRIKAER